MSDATLRTLTRRSAESGTVTDRIALLVEVGRIRAWTPNLECPEWLLDPMRHVPGVRSMFSLRCPVCEGTGKATWQGALEFGAYLGDQACRELVRPGLEPDNLVMPAWEVGDSLWGPHYGRLGDRAGWGRGLGDWLHGFDYWGALLRVGLTVGRSYVEDHAFADPYCDGCRWSTHLHHSGCPTLVLDDVEAYLADPRPGTEQNLVLCGDRNWWDSLAWIAREPSLAMRPLNLSRLCDRVVGAMGEPEIRRSIQGLLPWALGEVA